MINVHDGSRRSAFPVEEMNDLLGRLPAECPESTFLETFGGFRPLYFPEWGYLVILVALVGLSDIIAGRNRKRLSVRADAPLRRIDALLVVAGMGLILAGIGLIAEHAIVTYFGVAILFVFAGFAGTVVRAYRDSERRNGR